MAPWRLAAWALTALMAAGVSYSVLRIPVQTTDSLIPILAAHRAPSLVQAVMDNAYSGGYLRPLRIAQIQMLFDASGGRYFLAYKGFHVALAIACCGLFTLALRPRTRADFVALAVALTVLTGLHTFFMTVAEAYPINHFLEIAVLCLLTLVLAQSAGGWCVDLAAALTFVVAALTLESGLLVWVVAVGARATGMRGISMRGVAAMTVLLAAYLYVRFVYLATGVPALIERASGFGTARLEPDALMQRFGDWPYGFYAYNVASSLLTVLISEPRGGVWEIATDLGAGRMALGSIVNIMSSAVTSVVIGWFVVQRGSDWKRGTFAPPDRIVVVALLLLVANAAVSYAYTKDEIMSPAGVFYALAAFVGMRHALEWLGDAGRPRRVIIAAGCVLVIAVAGWSVRAVGLHYGMHRAAFNVRNEWVDVLQWLDQQGDPPRSESERQLVNALRDEAIAAGVVNPDWLFSRVNRLLR